MEFGVTPDMGLINDRSIPRNLMPRRLAFPIEVVIYDDALRHKRGAVPLVEGEVILGLKFVSKNRRVPFYVADVGVRVRIQYQLVGIKPVASVRFIRSVNPIPIHRFRPNIGNVAMPDLIGVFWQLDSCEFSFATSVEQAKLDFGGIRREEREIDALTVPTRTARKRQPFFNRRLIHRILTPGWLKHFKKFCTSWKEAPAVYWPRSWSPRIQTIF